MLWHHLLLLLLCQRAAAWITITQTRYGASLQRIQNESVGRDVGSPTNTLGHMFSLPDISSDSTGLGNSITWAWDVRVCDKLLPKFRDTFWGISLVGCGNLRSTMNRAFDTWAQNSRYIKFTDVTERCVAAGFKGSLVGCPHAEIVVSFLPDVNLTTSIRADEDPIVSSPTIIFSTKFTSTSSYRPFRGFGQDPYGPPGKFYFTSFRPVPEAIGGLVEFRSDVCWYLDSQFCQGFHDWKFIAGSTAARFFFNIFFFAAYGIVFYHVLKGFAVAVKKYSKLHDRLLTETGVDADGDGLDDVTFVARVETFFAILAEFSYRGMMMRLFLLMLPWPFWSAVGDCWDCYDLEAATAHHIGHMLGLGHPDRPTTDVYEDFQPEGTNLYHPLLSAGGRLNASTCENPWLDVPGLATRRGCQNDLQRPSNFNHALLHERSD